MRIRHVGDVSAHARCADEAARQVILERVTVDRGTLRRLPPPVQCGRLGAVERALEVHLEYVMHGIQRTVDERPLLPRDARVGDEHVQPAVEFVHDLVYCCFDGVVGVDVDLVGFACI